MTTPLHLTDDELLSLTHRRRPSAQARALKAMGVPYRTRPDGTLLVGRMNSALVEFEDGTKVVTSRYAVRKLIHNAELTSRRAGD